MTKYYRVKVSNFLWQEGAIISLAFENTVSPGYKPIEDIWDTTKLNGKEYISQRIIEAPENEQYFERVYEDTLGGRLFKTKEQMVNTFKEKFKE